MPAVEESLNRWIRQEAESMCRKAGMDHVPLSEPNFDFYLYGLRHLASKYKMRGAVLYETVSEVIQLIFFPINRQDGSTEGKMYRFPEWHERNPDRGRNGFDDFFRINFDQQSTTIVRWRSKLKYRPGIPILPGKDEGDPAGISEESLSGGGESPAELVERREDESLQKRSMGLIPQVLAEQRGGKILLFVWERLLQGRSLLEIADDLNHHGEEDPEYRSPRGGLWSAGTVSRLKNKIEEIARDRFGRDATRMVRPVTNYQIRAARAALQMGSRL